MMMENNELNNQITIEDKLLTGERALYGIKNADINNSTFDDGESPLKHAENLNISNSTFGWKYPIWHSNNISINNCTIKEMGRAGIWYTTNISVKNSEIIAPKEFRRCSNLSLENVNFTNAEETLWNCDKVMMKDVTAKGNYFAMNTNNLKIDNLNLDGNYPFDGCKNIEIRNSRLMSKDAFWNCENVVVYDSYINGEYLGWNSRNLTFINCTLESNQGLCYIENLTMKNCTLENTDLAFEYVDNVDAELKGKIISVKNPLSGKIVAEEIGELILDDTKIDPEKTHIICDKIGKTTLGISDPYEL